MKSLRPGSQSYEIVENSLKCLKSKIDLNPDNHLIVNFLNDSNITKHKFVDDGRIDLVYKNKINEDIFAITIRLARLDYSYMHYRYMYTAHTQDEDLNQIIYKKNVQFIGITIGDLIKHFYHNNNPGIDFCDNKNENDKMNELVKKSISIDTSAANLIDKLGIFSHHKQAIKLWITSLTTNQSHFTRRGDKKLFRLLPCDENNFALFCNKLLFFDDFSLFRILQKDKKTDRYYVDEKVLNNIFNKLSNKKIIDCFLKYYLYGECPSTYYIYRDEYDGTYYHFDIPSSVPDILKYFHEYFNNNEYINMYHKIMKLNVGQKRVLEEKYKEENVFDSISAVPDEYPIFAYRNVFLKQWNHKDLSVLCDHYCDYMRSVKDQKYKYKSSTSDKETLMINRFYNKIKKYNNYDQDIYFKKRNMYYEIQDNLKDYNDNYEIEHGINDEEILFDDLLIHDLTRQDYI